MDASLTEILSTLSERIPGFAEALEIERQGFVSWSCLSPETYQGKDVLDLGCGIGASSAVFIERGANSVWGIDPLLTNEQIAALSILPRSHFTAQLLLSEDVFGDRRFDLVYARFVTEHVMDLPATLSATFDLLRPGGRFVALHHNYYSPMGAHDFPFIEVVNTPEYEYTCRSRAVPCWESPDKCAASAEFRKEVEQKDWTIGTATLTPHDCSQCTYFHRAQLWGHLLYQDSFNRDYPTEFFRTNPDGSLNKVTPFQLRQFLVEAGFKVTTWELAAITNAPPPELMQLFSESDLRTLTILFAAEK